MKKRERGRQLENENFDKGKIEELYLYMFSYFDMNSPCSVFQVRNFKLCIFFEFFPLSVFLWHAFSTLLHTLCSVAESGKKMSMKQGVNTAVR